MIDVYESAIDEVGRFGAAFERDDETAYFYLLDMRKQDGMQIISTFNAKAVTELPAGTPVSVRWSSSAAAVGLFVGGTLLAIFDLRTATPIGRWADPADNRLFPVN
ncbi:DUF2251 domain-containing protein [Acidocella sp. KAb 2-4]|uniref:DUF2251 domain-containing protein n=1 Tax=Acidocella sp. KAb 2-4 TaxID=2885158 RepID=UPI001D065768|nr:DUF2251 domain-containing protein [Acidocella sp. KAb 2-4]MCB5946117.1 DUF2251 domain-containing protein [Acidocella sp. KAb 2-4]